MIIRKRLACNETWGTCTPGRLGKPKVFSSNCKWDIRIFDILFMRSPRLDSRVVVCVEGECGGVNSLSISNYIRVYS